MLTFNYESTYFSNKVVLTFNSSMCAAWSEIWFEIRKVFINQKSKEVKRGWKSAIWPNWFCRQSITVPSTPPSSMSRLDKRQKRDHGTSMMIYVLGEEPSRAFGSVDSCKRQLTPLLQAVPTGTNWRMPWWLETRWYAYSAWDYKKVFNILRLLQAFWQADNFSINTEPEMMGLHCTISITLAVKMFGLGGLFMK